MRYAGVIKNDIAAAPGVSISVFTQGCPHRCYGCHNPETWDFEGGKDLTSEKFYDIINNIRANGIKRNLCIMGGEPLCSENLFIVALLIQETKKKYPDTPIYIWTGYLYEELLKESESSPHLKYILENIDCLIDGPYIESKRDITLHMRGSSNQRVIYFNRENNDK